MMGLTPPLPTTTSSSLQPLKTLHLEGCDKSYICRGLSILPLVVHNLKEGVPAQVSSSLLGHSSKFQGSKPILLSCSLVEREINIYSTLTLAYCKIPRRKRQYQNYLLRDTL
ncbi:hypothetical protein TNCV_2731241 [Trichonephila clavipes]|nr:hypothetical protein TNCV_2731241 [Trichonephila clavipes]